MPRRMPGAITFEEAVQVAQEALGRGASFPFPQYPLVKETNERVEVRFDEPVNVVLIFVERLDRRYLDRTIDVSVDSKQPLAPGTPSGRSIRLTPFLDRLKDESLYFERSRKGVRRMDRPDGDRKSTRLNSSHLVISYAVFCLKKNKIH